MHATIRHHQLFPPRPLRQRQRAQTPIPIRTPRATAPRTSTPALLRNHNRSRNTIRKRAWARPARAADRDSSSANPDNIVIAITVTMVGADAINVDAADSAAAAVVEAAARNSKPSAVTRVSAHRSLQSFRTAKLQVGSTRSATADSSADQRTVI